MTKILVAEDDKALNGLVSAYLKDNGYAVTSCKNGAEAYSALENDTFDMLLTDIMMPEMDGFTLAERVRERDKRIPILFLTAKDDKISKQFG